MQDKNQEIPEFDNLPKYAKRQIKKLEKLRLKGTLVWNSKKHGTFKGNIKKDLT